MRKLTHHLRPRLPIDSSTAAMLLIDSEEIIEGFNQVANQSLGYEESELLGRPMKSIFPELTSSDRATHRARTLSQLRDPGLPQVLVGQARRKDGSVFESQVTVYPLCTAIGGLWIVNVIDLSSAAVQDEDWIQGERLAAVQQMASGLAHESRNALQRAESCLDLLQLDLSGRPELMELCDQIRKALKDILRLYEEVNDYAAPIRLRRSVVDLAELCQTTFADLTSSHRDRVPRLTLYSTIAYKFVKLDVARFGDAMTRVLTNAIHASDPGSLIEVHCASPPPAEPPEIKIVVRDHGTGLTDEVEKRMFEPFFTTNQKGTGLGLAVARRIVQAHQGTIQATNHPEGGTVVEIRLPASVATELSP